MSLAVPYLLITSMCTVVHVHVLCSFTRFDFLCAGQVLELLLYAKSTLATAVLNPQTVVRAEGQAAQQTIENKSAVASKSPECKLTLHDCVASL